MIPRDYITEWRMEAPWVENYQVEQDLVISRAIDSATEATLFQHLVLIFGFAPFHSLSPFVAAQPAPDAVTIAVTEKGTDQLGAEVDSVAETARCV